MLMPTIANGPGQGPPIARQGAPDTRAGNAPQRDMKDAFGALFRKGDTPGQGGATSPDNRHRHLRRDQ